jgi:hypothetical protein
VYSDVRHLQLLEQGIRWAMSKSSQP